MRAYSTDRRARVSLFLAALLALGTTAGDTPAGDRPLFLNTARQPAVPLPESPRLLRTRYVEVNFAALDAAVRPNAF
jgi:hypothetical protein